VPVFQREVEHRPLWDGTQQLVEKIAAALTVVGRLIEGDDRC
jgi:hypothetical protein